MLSDLRYAFRMLLKNPGFTTVALLTLALGIGANTAIFSLVYGVLLRPLSFADTDRIVSVWSSTREQTRSGHSAADFLDLQRENASLDALAGYRNVLWSASARQAPPVQLEGAYVTTDFFDVLRAPTILGRTFSRADGPAIRARSVVLSQSAWRQLFGSSADAIGQSIRLNGEPHTVTAVLAPHAEWPRGSRLWVLSDKEVPPSPIDSAQPGADREVRYFDAIGRLKPGIALEQAQVDFSRLAAILRQRQAQAAVQRDLKVGPLREQLVGEVRTALVVLQGAVAIVLLIACANVSSLLIARATGRGREIALRAALGASRARLVRHLIAESLVLGVIGGIAGLLLGAWLLSLLVTVLPEGMPRIDEIALDRVVTAITMLIAIATALLFGVLPAFQASRADAGTALKASGERGNSARAQARSALVVAEIALTVVLLAGASLLLSAFLRLQRTDSGFRPERVTVMGLMLPQSRYSTSASQVALYRQLVDGLSERPEVEGVGVGFPGPLRGNNASGHFDIEGRPVDSGHDQPFAHIGSVSGGYFQAMGIPLVAGRTFTGADREDAPGVAIVSQEMARRYWPGEQALGKRLRFDESADAGWITVVGIAGDVRQLGLDKDFPPVLYIPFEQFPLPFTNLAVRSSAPDSAVAALMREQVTRADSDLPAGELASLSTILSQSIEVPRFRGLLLSAFAGTALVLAAVGIYGLISYSVTQRTREIGIRVALGAQPRQVLAPVLREGLRLAVTGAVIGLVGALLASRVLSQFLFGIEASPVTFGAVCLLLLGVAMLATYVPSRRALRVDPIAVLKSE
jgi:putative ABC transport system permease protein